MQSLQNFRSYQLAKALYQECSQTKIHGSGLRDQLLRASSSIALNLAEGAANAPPSEARRGGVVEHSEQAIRKSPEGKQALASTQVLGKAKPKGSRQVLRNSISFPPRGTSHL